jgi:hypothetical protein
MTMRIAICSLIVDDAAARAAGRLVRSLRWFGGTAAMAPVALVTTQALDPEVTRALAAEGVSLQVASPDWRPLMAEVVAGLAVDLALLVRSETLILQDPTAALVRGQLVPPAEAIAAHVEPALVHHRPGDPVDASMLTAAQEDLFAVLEAARVGSGTRDRGGRPTIGRRRGRRL